MVWSRKVNLFSILVSIPCHNPGIWGWSTIYRVPDTSCFRLEGSSTFCQFKKLSCQRVITMSAADTGLHMAMPSCCLQSNLSFWNYMNLVWKFISPAFGMWFNLWWLVSSVQWNSSESAGLPIAVSREAHNFILASPTSSLLLDDGYLGPMFWRWYK